MSYRGRVQNGVVVLDGNLKLPEGAVVQIEPITAAESVGTDGGWAKDLLEMAGTVRGLPSDLARNHDHYLYGTPKK